MGTETPQRDHGFYVGQIIEARTELKENGEWREHIIISISEPLDNGWYEVRMGNVIVEESKLYTRSRIYKMDLVMATPWRIDMISENFDNETPEVKARHNAYVKEYNAGKLKWRPIGPELNGYPGLLKIRLEESHSWPRDSDTLEKFINNVFI